MQKIGDIPNTRADSNGEFTDGNVAGGVPPTILPAEWFNTIQRELVTVVQDGGLTLDPNDDTQVLAALKKLFLQSGNNLSEIKDAGPTAITQTLANLGLGEAAKLGVATNSQMAAGTNVSLLPSVAAVMSIFSKRTFTGNDYIRIPDVPGGLIIQWGLLPNLLQNINTSSAWSALLPIPFPNSIIGGTVTTGATQTPLSSGATLSNTMGELGMVTTIAGYVQNTRIDQGVNIYYIAIGY
ncbi:gp53-like domain-containing protein [Yersinia wautersii]|uniref:gp53-like domain-containing protein n=1 Tax=Yersinia wautersii TaxID=1341643 RepID=UPI0004032950|nr:hypothetical protein [Yersinia wautersii]